MTADEYVTFKQAKNKFLDERFLRDEHAALVRRQGNCNATPGGEEMCLVNINDFTRVSQGVKDIEGVVRTEDVGDDVAGGIRKSLRRDGVAAVQCPVRGGESPASSAVECPVQALPRGAQQIPQGLSRAVVEAHEASFEEMPKKKLRSSVGKDEVASIQVSATAVGGEATDAEDGGDPDDDTYPELTALRALELNKKLSGQEFHVVQKTSQSAANASTS